jgi:hypothetical protein
MPPLFSEANFAYAISEFIRFDGLLYLMIIIAILMGGIMGIMKLCMIHRERMAMIERGIHPDGKDEESPLSENVRAVANLKP